MSHRRRIPMAVLQLRNVGFAWSPAFLGRNDQLHLSLHTLRRVCFREPRSNLLDTPVNPLLRSIQSDAGKIPILGLIIRVPVYRKPSITQRCAGEGVLPFVKPKGRSESINKHCNA